ncbi:MAG: helix-turn-helix domain-containing protein [Oscillospiraceae bacterium]|nr:helix-turn-helix domain-containing protein [Oscillospiraceae bacterium]
MINNYSLGNKLRELRRSAELSQEQLALEAGITPHYFGQVERGEKNITVHTLEKICRVLNISLSDFFSGFDAKNPAVPDEVSNQILYQLNGKSPEEKQAILRMIKLIFAVQKMK